MKSEKVQKKRSKSRRQIRSKSKKVKKSIHKKIKSERKIKRSGSKKLRRSVRKIKSLKIMNKKSTRRSNSKNAIIRRRSGRKIIDGKKTLSKQYSILGKIQIEILKTSINDRLDKIKRLQKEINETANFFSKNNQNIEDFDGKETFEQKRQKIFDENKQLLNDNIKISEEIAEEDENQKISEQMIKNYNNDIISMKNEVKEKENEMKNQANIFNERIKKVDEEINNNNKKINENKNYLELVENKKKNIIRLQQLIEEKEKKEKESQGETSNKLKELNTENVDNLIKEDTEPISTNSVAQSADGSKKDGGWGLWFWSSSPENEIEKLNTEIKKTTDIFSAKSTDFEKTVVPEMNNDYIKIIESLSIKKSNIETEKNNLLDQLKSKIDSIKDGINNKLIEIEKHNSKIKLCREKQKNIIQKKSQNSTLIRHNEELIKIIKTMYDKLKTNSSKRIQISAFEKELETFRKEAKEHCDKYLTPMKNYLEKLEKLDDSSLNLLNLDQIKEKIKEEIKKKYEEHGKIFTDEKLNNVQNEIKLIDNIFDKPKKGEKPKINKNKLNDLVSRFSKNCKDKYTLNSPPPLPPKNTNDGGFF
jgi:hypothetical protein